MKSFDKWFDDQTPMTIAFWVMGIFIIPLFIAAIVVKDSKYVVCQFEQCYRVDTYTKTPTGLDFIYDNKTRVLEGPYTLRER